MMNFNLEQILITGLLTCNIYPLFVGQETQQREKTKCHGEAVILSKGRTAILFDEHKNLQYVQTLTSKYL
jgi:hypothetical protein